MNIYFFLWYLVEVLSKILFIIIFAIVTTLHWADRLGTRPYVTLTSQIRHSNWQFFVMLGGENDKFQADNITPCPWFVYIQIRVAIVNLDFGALKKKTWESRPKYEGIFYFYYELWTSYEPLSSYITKPMLYKHNRSLSHWNSIQIKLTEVNK